MTTNVIFAANGYIDYAETARMFDDKEAAWVHKKKYSGMSWAIDAADKKTVPWKDGTKVVSYSKRMVKAFLNYRDGSLIVFLFQWANHNGLGCKDWGSLNKYDYSSGKMCPVYHVELPREVEEYLRFLASDDEDTGVD